MAMIDRKKVIKGLEHCEFGGSSPCYENECPYYQSHDCTDELKNDILAMLEEQETVDKNTGKWKNGHCSCCGEDVSSMLDTWTNVQSFLYCPECGAKMEE